MGLYFARRDLEQATDHSRQRREDCLLTRDGMGNRGSIVSIRSNHFFHKKILFFFGCYEHLSSTRSGGKRPILDFLRLNGGFPVALSLKRIRRYWHATPDIGAIKTLPIDRNPVGIERAKALQQSGPILLLAFQRGQPEIVLVWQAAFPQRKQRGMRPHLYKDVLARCSKIRERCSKLHWL